MQELLQTLIIAVIAGAFYSLIALGMVLVYRTTGVLNVAHGGIGVLCGFVAWDLITLRHVPYYLGVLTGIVVAVLLGLAFERIVIRRLAGRPDLQTISTLALFILAEGFVFIVPWWGNTWGQLFPSPLPRQDGAIPAATTRSPTTRSCSWSPPPRSSPASPSCSAAPGWGWRCGRSPTTAPRRG